ncbi:hypothetical protein GA0070609_0481 [Micromonospora echinaurantiaca]|uniref:Uncharacterized protein n=1 Tax=Micromonospora echinaurantiaca TaxID=47857 RepID=A0A1C5GVP7_9ACTN|nr:hypothetical protein GA0070609_0481 [Micromonospora echinaurantiaca]
MRLAAKSISDIAANLMINGWRGRGRGGAGAGAVGFDRFGGG